METHAHGETYHLKYHFILIGVTFQSRLNWIYSTSLHTAYRLCEREPPGKLAHPLGLLVGLALADGRCIVMVNMMVIINLIVYASVLIIMWKYSDARETLFQ